MQRWKIWTLRLKLILSGKDYGEYKENLGYYELKQQKPWFDERCSKLLDQMKQIKLHWLKHPSEINGANVNNVRREVSIQFQE
jgi:hypothetical protein